MNTKTPWILFAAIGILASLAVAACSGDSTAEALPTPDVGTGSAPVPQGFAEPEFLVDTDWVARHEDDPNMQVLDIRSADDYADGHIPGAVSFPTSEFTATVNELPNMAPSAEDFARAATQAGVGNFTQAVIVDGGNMLWASRLMWTLEYFGHRKISILHGGHAAWVADGREVTRKASTVTGALIFTAVPNPSLVANVSEVLTRLDDPGLVLLDNRSPDEYAGEDVRTKRGGHVPGAVNINWGLHLNSGDVPTLKSASELASLYRDAGVTMDKEIASYCQTAVRAAHGYLVLRLLGYDKLKVYDGSWVEWGNRSDTPVER